MSIAATDLKVTVELTVDQLIQAVKQLPADDRARLISEVDPQEQMADDDRTSLNHEEVVVDRIGQFLRGEVEMIPLDQHLADIRRIADELRAKHRG